MMKLKTTSMGISIMFKICSCLKGGEAMPPFVMCIGCIIFKVFIKDIDMPVDMNIGCRFCPLKNL